MDAFGKTMEDIKVKTRTGALLTLISAAIICTFTTMEFMDYRRIQRDTSMIVDRSRGEKLNIRMNITFPHVPCYLLSLDVMDISGEHQDDLTHDIVKTRLGSGGEPIWTGQINGELKNELDKVAAARGPNYCGSCYGGEPPGDAEGCCNSCEAVRQAYLNRGWAFADPDSIDQCVSEHWKEKIQEQSHEGCNIAGRIKINKVIGNIHLSPGKSFQMNGMYAHELVPYLKDGNHHEWGHYIHQFAFESPIEEWKSSLSETMRKKLGIVVQPLDFHRARTTSPDYMFQYFLKVVGVRYHFLDHDFVQSYQYSTTSYERDLTPGSQGAQSKQGIVTSHANTGQPGAFFNFEISPMMVIHRETRQSFAHFVTSTCAIIGGVLTIASLFDGLLFSATRALQQGSTPTINANGYKHH